MVRNATTSKLGVALVEIPAGSATDKKGAGGGAVETITAAVDAIMVEVVVGTTTETEISAVVIVVEEGATAVAAAAETDTIAETAPAAAAEIVSSAETVAIQEIGTTATAEMTAALMTVAGTAEEEGIVAGTTEEAETEAEIAVTTETTEEAEAATSAGTLVAPWPAGWVSALPAPPGGAPLLKPACAPTASRLRRQSTAAIYRKATCIY